MALLCYKLKPGIHVATDCNVTSHRSHLQRVLGLVAASCSQSPISDTKIFSCDDPSRCKSLQRVCQVVASTRTLENVFYIIYFFANEDVAVSYIASRHSMYVLNLQILETGLAVSYCKTHFIYDHVLSLSQYRGMEQVKYNLYISATHQNSESNMYICIMYILF